MQTMLARPVQHRTWCCVAVLPAVPRRALPSERLVPLLPKGEVPAAHGAGLVLRLRGRIWIRTRCPCLHTKKVGCARGARSTPPKVPVLLRACARVFVRGHVQVCQQHHGYAGVARAVQRAPDAAAEAGKVWHVGRGQDANELLARRRLARHRAGRCARPRVVADAWEWCARAGANVRNRSRTANNTTPAHACSNQPPHDQTSYYEIADDEAPL